MVKERETSDLATAKDARGHQRLEEARRSLLNLKSINSQVSVAGVWHLSALGHEVAINRIMGGTCPQPGSKAEAVRVPRGLLRAGLGAGQPVSGRVCEHALHMCMRVHCGVGICVHTCDACTLMHT